MKIKAKSKQRQSLVGQLKRCLLIVASLIASIFIFSIPVSILTSSARQSVELQQLALQQDQSNLQLSMFNQATDLRRYITTNNATYLVSFQKDRQGYLFALQDLKSQAQGSDFRLTALALPRVEQRVDSWFTNYAQVQVANMQSGKLAIARSDTTAAAGRALFDQFLTSAAQLQKAINHDIAASHFRLSLPGVLTFFGVLLLAIMAVLVLWYTLRRFFKALRAQLSMLMSTTNLLRSGDLSARVQELSYDELDRVGQTINIMAEELAKHSRDLKRSNEELMGLNSALEEANGARSQFLSTMSHELRTPLASIIGFSQLLLEDTATTNLSRQQQVNLERILKNGQHLLGLVSDVLDLEKIEAGPMEITYAQVDVPDLIAEVVEEMQSLAIERHLVLRAEVKEGLSSVESNAVKLHQILLNLVSNALKYTKEGEVVVSARRLIATGEEPDSVAIAVKDTGIGIPLAAQARIFEAFYQVEGGYTRKSTGTGLGLAITSRLTSLLGATIELTSAPEQGSTFTVTLPIKARQSGARQEIPRLHPEREAPARRTPSSPLELAADSARREAAAGQSGLVLAVDDNADVILLIKDALKESPFSVVGVQDPAQVIDLVQEMHPSAITLDVLMADVNGWQILHQLKSNLATASIPVVMLTVISEPAAGYVLGADDYLVKPFNKETLLNTLQNVIASQRELSQDSQRQAQPVSKS